MAGTCIKFLTLISVILFYAIACNARCLDKKIDDYETYLTKYLGTPNRLAILLDYDGTLTPIVAHPDLAKIPEETKTILEKLSKTPGIYVGIVSGRNVNNVKEMVGIDGITYAGNHGLEVIYHDGSKYHHQLPTEFDGQVSKMIKQLENSVVRDGAWIENKGASLTFHFRSTPDELKDEIRETARTIMEASNFKVGNAHMALEARPKVDWNKGKVSLLILEKEFGEKWYENVKVIFAGDDTTDEDALQALKGKAATFRIASSIEVSTHADKLLSSTTSVVNILKLVQRLFDSKN